MTFHAAFGRRLNYYTGFVFDMVRPEKPLAEVIAGGRYDRWTLRLHCAAYLVGAAVTTGLPAAAFAAFREIA